MALRRNFLLLFLPCASVAFGGPMPPPAAEQDSVPQSALLRLGTTRFRPGAQQNMVAFSPDGRYLASGGHDYRLRVWEVPSGKQLKSFSVQYYQVNTLRFSPDSKMLAAGTADGLIRVWSVGDWIERSPPPPPNRNWNPPFFDWRPDSKSVVCLGREGKLRIIEPLSGREIQSWQIGGSINPSSLMCSPDGKLAVSQGYDYLLRVWNLSTGQEVKTIEVPTTSSRIYRSYPRLHFSADGKILAGTENDRSVLIWNVETGKIVRRLEIPGYLQSIALSPQGRTLASSSGNNVIRLWGVASGRELRTFDTPREAATALTFSPDGKQLVSSGAAALRFWDIDSDRELYADRGHRAAVSGLVFLDGHHRLASIGNDATLRYWDCAKGIELDRHSSLQSYFYGSFFVAVNGGRSVLLPMSNMGLQRWTPAESRMQYVGLSTPGYVSSLSADGQLAAMAVGTAYRIFDVATGKEARSIEAPNQQTNVNTISTGRRYFAAAHGYRDPFSASQVSVYRLATGRRWRPLMPPHAQPMPAIRLVFSRDTRFLAVIYSNSEVRVWELATGVPRLVLAPPPRSNEPNRNITAAIFTPDSRCLIVGDSTGQLTICGLDRGEPLHLSGAHNAGIQSLVCSDDGERLATGSADTSILIWDLHDLRRRAPQRTPLAAVPATEQLDHAWNMLGTTDEKAVGDAIWLFSQYPDRTVAFLRAKLQPVRSPSGDEIARWVLELGERRWAIRENATQSLAAAGENARMALIKAFLGPASNPEARHRLERLLRRLDDGLTPVKLQPVRAVEVLERIQTPAALQVLVDLARRTTDVVVKEEIDGALVRMGK